MSSEACGFRLVERNTFLELDIYDLDAELEEDTTLDEHNDFELRVDKDDCMSEPSSDVTTHPPSTRWSEQASEGSESDHEDAFPEYSPPPCQQGTPTVGQFAMVYYVPTMMVAAPMAPAAPAAQNFPVRSTQKKKPKTNKDTRTTLMIQNVPSQCTNTMMVEMLDSAGFFWQVRFRVRTN